MYDQKCNEKSCTFNRNGKCTKLHGKCIKETNNSNLIKNNINNIREIRKRKYNKDK